MKGRALIREKMFSCTAVFHHEGFSQAGGWFSSRANSRGVLVGQVFRLVVCTQVGNYRTGSMSETDKLRPTYCGANPS